MTRLDPRTTAGKGAQRSVAPSHGRALRAPPVDRPVHRPRGEYHAGRGWPAPPDRPAANAHSRPDDRRRTADTADATDERRPRRSGERERKKTKPPPRRAAPA